MKRLIFSTLMAALLCTSAAAAQPKSQINQGKQPMAPVYRDPITDGAADPCVFYNPFEKEWWMLYTQRRANVESADVAFCFGNEIGIACSEDNGASWKFRGTLDLEMGRGKNTFWAPDVVLHEGVYHMFVSYIKGVSNYWGTGGPAKMAHYTSTNLWDWNFEGFLELEHGVIDATLLKMKNGKWRMWYKWKDNSYYADSKDLYKWELHPKPAIADKAHEGSKAFEFGGYYWMVTDEWAGMAVYRSDDLEKWTKQEGRLLSEPSKRRDDRPSGSHGDVVVTGDRAYIFYFTHPGRKSHLADPRNELGNVPYELRRSSIQVAELYVEDGVLKVRDRDQPFNIYLPNL